MSYRAPVEDILFTMRHVAGMQVAGKNDAGKNDAVFADLGDGVAEAVIEEAAKFAEARLSPLNRRGDTEMARLVDGKVVMPRGFDEAYRDWAAGGWAGVAATPDFGGPA